MFLKRNSSFFCRGLNGADSNNLPYRLPREDWIPVTAEFVAYRLCLTIPLNLDRPLKLLQRNDTLVIRLALFQPAQRLVRGMDNGDLWVSFISCNQVQEMTT